jgi:hypothetical protein
VKDNKDSKDHRDIRDSKDGVLSGDVVALDAFAVLDFTFLPLTHSQQPNSWSKRNSQSLLR